MGKAIRYGGITLLVLLLFIVIWGFFIEPYTLDVQEQEATITNLPPAWEGQRIGLIADFQYGMWMANTSTMERAVNQLIEDNPAAVLIAGDFVYHLKENWREDIETVIGIVRPLSDAGIPTYAVLGNHDYGMSTSKDQKKSEQAEGLKTALEEVGIQVLQNEADTLLREDASLYIAGIGSHVAGEDQPELALSEVPEDAARIVLMHNPNSYEAIPANTAPLAVAGHTHGGQFRLPFTPQWSWMTYQRENKVHADGWIEEEYGAAGNNLYVNRGIGFSLIPARLNCPPELTYFTLRASGNS